MDLLDELDHLSIPLEEIKQATNNFSDKNCIAGGGFGRVYKGKLIRSYASASSLENQGKSVAVKRLDRNWSHQGMLEFTNEIQILSKYRHRNVVSLVGFCDEKAEKILVYEYASRGSLNKNLATTNIMWVQRLRICIGAARGLNYLHSNVGEGLRVIHGDVKSANIVLDADWEAMVSDFGFARIAETNQSEFAEVCGTPGYTDPSFQKSLKLTTESDVYSFGVTLFEVLCGRAVMMVNFQDERQLLTDLVRTCYKEGRLEDIVEPNLLQHMNKDSFRYFYRIAYQCLKHDGKKRPTMGAIIKQLEISLKYQEGCRHAPIKGGYWGSTTCGGPFSFPLESHQKLKRVVICHGNWIHCIHITAEEPGRLFSEQFGASLNGKFDEINFGAYEEIIGISGTVGYTSDNWFNRGCFLVTSLSIKTTKKTYGPYGQHTDKKSFSKDWDAGSFAGFYVRCGLYLDGLGCYLNDITQDGPST